MKLLLAIFAPILALQLFAFTGCQSNATPEAVAYDTLRQAANVLDAKHALFEVEVTKGTVAVAKQRQIRESYIAAKEAIINAAVVAESGLQAETPEEVSRLVTACISLITQILPPEPR